MKNTNSLVTSSTSIWQKETPFHVKTTAWPQNKEVDVVIIGMGVVGLWLAFHLKKRHKNLSILIVEKGPRSDGASIGNAGFLCIGSVSELIATLKALGSVSELYELILMRVKGMDIIKKEIGEKLIDYDPCKGYECLMGPPSSHSLIGDHMKMVNEILQSITGIYPVFKISDKEKINRFGFNGITTMIENSIEGSLNSGKLLRTLTQKVVSMGVMLCNHFEATTLTDRGGSIVVGTSSNQSYTGRQVFICTNGYTRDFFPGGPRIIPGRGQILLTSEIPDLPFEGTFHMYEGDDYYFRNYGKRLLFGGGRKIDVQGETTTSTRVTDKIQNSIERMIHDHILPGRKFKVEQRWARPMGFTDSHKPIIFNLPHFNDVHVLCACNGLGVAPSAMFTKTVADQF